MEFLYLFDLIDFDENGIVCEGSHGISQSQSNFLYLLSKYNQVILKEENLPIPDFFKSELFSVLEAVCEGNFGASKKKVLENCHLKVQQIANSAKSDKELISLLNDTISARDEDFAKLVGKNINHLQLAYIITSLSGKIEKKIELAIENGLQDKMVKSKTFKDIIKYNRLMLTAQKVGSGELTVKDLCPVVA